jgi:molybdopterin/thiamine biosynthesis adenylyltransferase
VVLIDPEILETENVFRHNCTLKDIGLRKTYALKKRLQEINPQVSINIINEKIEAITENVDSVIKDSDIIVNATGSSENLINNYCYSRNISSIHAKVYPFGFGGEVISIIPKIHPCFECQNQQLNKLLDEVPKLNDFPLNKTVDYNITNEGEELPIPSLAIDASFINNITAKMTIDILLLQLSDLKNIPNIILWGNKREWIFEQSYSCKKVDTSNFKSFKNCIICNNKTSIETELSMNPIEIEDYYHQLNIE